MKLIAAMKYPGLPFPESRQPTPVEKDSQLETAVEQYQIFTAGCNPTLRRFSSAPNHFTYAQECLTSTLTPAQINIFLQHIARIKDPPERRGTALSALMGNAYAIGHSTFHLFLPDTCCIDNCGEYLKGSKERPYTIHVTGRLSYHSFRGAEYVNSTANEIVDENWGCDSKSSVLYAREFKGHSLGDRAVGTTFRMHNSYWLPRFNVVVLQEANDCTVQVYREADFQQWLLMGISAGRGNKVQWVKEETHEVIEEVVIWRKR